MSQKKEYVREVDEQTYRAYKQQQKAQEIRKQRLMNPSPKLKEKALKKIKESKALEKMKRLDFVRVNSSNNKPK